MAAPDLHGPYPLDPDIIQVVLPAKGAGVFALGQNHEGEFHVRYVGRSDSDIGQRLLNYVGAYSHFQFGYVDSAGAAFENECRLYHNFGESLLDNRAHPLRPAHSGWNCPTCASADY
jgi:hypothetical protein